MKHCSINFQTFYWIWIFSTECS